MFPITLFNRPLVAFVWVLLGALQVMSGQGFVTVAQVSGKVESSLDHRDWAAVAAGARLGKGVSLRTAPGASADLLLDYNGSVMRLAGDSALDVQQLEKIETGIDMVTETRLNVTRGQLLGSQRKLHKPSVLAISTPMGEAVIRGTEYVVNQQGGVSVLSGSVEVVYNLPGNKGSIKVTVNAGQTFDPATGQVVATTPEHLQNILADMNVVRQNAEVFKAGGATIVVKAQEDFLSPTTPNGNNGVGNGVDPQPPGNPPVNDGPGTGPGNPGNQGGKK
jgi:hypothetical protein